MSDRVDVALVSMPWESLMMPSIQLGILKPLVERAGFSCRTHALNVALMDLVGGAGFTLGDYSTIANSHSGLGLGDWIFALPPVKPADPEDDERYLAYLAERGSSPRTRERALAVRAQVPAFIERCVDLVLADRPRVVGFSSTFSQNVPSLLLAHALEARDPSLTVVFGGANCEGPMGEALHRLFPWVDVVVRGEGERVFPQLLREVLGGLPISEQPGLIFRRDGASVVVPEARGGFVPMREVPAPDYGEWFARVETSPHRADILGAVTLPFESARGCWWGAKSHCTFCGLNGATMAFRSKPAAQVHREVLDLAQRHQVLRLQAVDNIIDMDYLRELLPALTAEGLDLEIFYETKANLTRDQVRALARAGVRRIQPGVESLSTPILKRMKKGVTGLHNLRLLKWCAAAGVRVDWNIIYGFPGEPAEEYARMAALVPSLVHLEPPNFTPLGLDRFSPYHQAPEAYGLRITGPRRHYAHIYGARGDDLMDLAYKLEFEHLDGRRPLDYAAPLGAAIAEWRRVHARAVGSLRAQRGPGFVKIVDRRPGLPARTYTLEGDDALIYLLADGGEAPAGIAARLAERGGRAGEAEVRALLDELAEHRLVVAEADRYLSLALPVEDREEPALVAPLPAVASLARRAVA